MLHLSLRYRIPRIMPIGEVFEHHCQFKHVTREQSRYSFNDIEIPIADDGRLPSELGIQDKDTLRWSSPLVDLAGNEEPEEAATEEAVTEDAAMEEAEAAPIALSTGAYECIDEYCRISEEDEDYLSEEDCYRDMIRVDIQGYADGECWQ